MQKYTHVVHIKRVYTMWYYISAAELYKYMFKKSGVYMHLMWINVHMMLY